MLNDAMDAATLRRDWFAYYTEKRIVHQWTQVSLLQGLPVDTVLEVGPHLGLVTAMLSTAGYRVSTLDVAARPLLGAEKTVQADIRAATAADFGGHDAIICCETLEHVRWAETDAVLQRMAAGGAKWLVCSVPFEGPQLQWSLYANLHLLRQAFGWRPNRFLRRFKVTDWEDFGTHKWEVGYRDYPLRAWEAKLEANGWAIRRRAFTATCRSVFHVCERR